MINAAIILHILYTSLVPNVNIINKKLYNNFNLLKIKISSEIQKFNKKTNYNNFCHLKAHFCQNINRKGRKIRKGFLFLSSIERLENKNQ